MKRMIAVIAALTLLLTLAGCVRREEGTPGNGTEAVTPPDGDTGTDAGSDNGSDGGTEKQPDAGQEDKDPDSGTGDTEPGGGEDGPDAGGEQVSPVLAAAPGPVADALSGLEGWTAETAGDAAAKLESGEARAAVIPLGAAARLYNATDGQVRVCALLSLGGWVVAEQGDSVSSIFSLAGKTVLVPDAAPEAAAVFEYILREYGFEPGDTIILEKTPDAGSGDLALVPAEQAGRAAIDLLEEFETVTDSRMWPGMCLAVRADAEDAGALVSTAESALQGAKSAYTGLEFTWVSGADTLRETLEEYLTLLYELDPALIGGFIPDDGFYG